MACPDSSLPLLTRQAAQRCAKRLRGELDALGHPLALMPAQDLLARVLGFEDWRRLQAVWPDEPAAVRPPQPWRQGTVTSWRAALAFLEREGWTSLYLGCGQRPLAGCGRFALPDEATFFDGPALTVDAIEAFMVDTGFAVPKRGESRQLPRHEWTVVSPTGARWLCQALWSLLDVGSQPGWQVTVRAQQRLERVDDLPVPAALQRWLAKDRTNGLILLNDLDGAPWSLTETLAAVWAHTSGRRLHAGCEFAGQGLRERTALDVQPLSGFSCDFTLQEAAEDFQKGDGLATVSDGDWVVAVEAAEEGLMVWASLPTLRPPDTLRKVMLQHGRLLPYKANQPDSVAAVSRGLRLQGRDRWKRAVGCLEGIVVTGRDADGDRRDGKVQWVALDPARREELQGCAWGNAGTRTIEHKLSAWMAADGSDWQPLDG